MVMGYLVLTEEETNLAGIPFFSQESVPI